MFEALETRLKRYEELEGLVTDPKVIADSSAYQRHTKELASLRNIVSKYREYKKVDAEIVELEDLLKKKSQDASADAEFTEMAKEELLGLRKKRPELEGEIDEMLLENDPDADKNIIVEIRAGTGGREASLFAADLFRMYSKYAAGQGWKAEMLSSSISEAGGFKEVVFGIDGNGVYRKMKFESGVHRVQRVPETEASGRIHTSAVTVVVLPEAEGTEGPRGGA